MHPRPPIRTTIPSGFRPDAMPPREFAPHHKEFHHSAVNAGAIMRSTGRMMLAGWLIEKLALKEQMHRTFAYAAAGILTGYAEKLFQDRKERKHDGRGNR